MDPVRVGLAAAGLLSLPAIWGVAVEPYRVELRHEEAPIPHLPPAWQGQRVALFGDLQVGAPLANVRTVRQVVRAVVAARPALVLIAGDLLYAPPRHLARQLRTVMQLLRPLHAAGIPAYAVLGNHDYPDPEVPNPGRICTACELQRALDAVGVHVLRNEAIALPPPAGAADAEARGATALHLVGIGPRVPDRDEPVAAVRQVPADAPRLLLMHQPGTYDELPPYSAPLALAGHTHGGQIRIPFKPKWSGYSLVKRAVRQSEGWITDRGQPGNRLYVNRGIGFSSIPVRFGCPPELTFFTLRSA
jgi:uncharacterized protein